MHPKRAFYKQSEGPWLLLVLQCKMWALLPMILDTADFGCSADEEIDEEWNNSSNSSSESDSEIENVS